ncbi:MAG TPA: hypothetical protein VHY58_25365 [Streptosporangiaceae bacterium]|jgi:hypothetical protein|nr:hypothetical protein [Streptosporangiaceae bacterium]
MHTKEEVQQLQDKVEELFEIIVVVVNGPRPVFPPFIHGPYTTPAEYAFTDLALDGLLDTARTMQRQIEQLKAASELVSADERVSADRR